MHKMMSRVVRHLLYRGKGVGKCRANSLGRPNLVSMFLLDHIE